MKLSKTTLKSPYILEDLEPDSSYEVYVQARNIYGLGNPTARIVFRTAKASMVDLKASSSTSEVIYDQPECCTKAGVKEECLPMCQYNASLSEIRRLTSLCEDDLVKVTKCAAGNNVTKPSFFILTVFFCQLEETICLVASKEESRQNVKCYAKEFNILQTTLSSQSVCHLLETS